MDCVVATSFDPAWPSVNRSIPIFLAWIDGSSDADLQAEFKIVKPTKAPPALVQ
jgi:hypothetical protein